MKKLFLHIILIFISFNLFAQNPEIKRTWHWYFGCYAGIDFSSGTAVFDYSPLYTTEGTATISDINGNLLFYTNGVAVWNSIHDTMPNGDSLLGHMSSTQSALIVPMPESTTKYYIFTADYVAGYFGGFGGVSYSIIDMTLDGGLGDIIPIYKNILLLTPTTEKLAGTRHSNGIDYWVITHEWDTNNFYTYLITSSGIDSIPVISSIGAMHSGGVLNNDNARGYLKLSPDGNKLALVTKTPLVELFDFNNTTGIISNFISLPADGGEYGISFSPDNSKLYVNKNLTPVRIFQYDLKGSPADIINSKTSIAYPSSYLGAMQLAPEGKIYVARVNQDYLGIINEPNETGIVCNYVDSAGIVQMPFVS